MFDVGKSCLRHPVYRGIARLDDVILIRCMLSASVSGTEMPGGQSRWSAGKDLSWEPLRIERVCEVKYDHLQGSRFRHATTFLRWRPDKQPADCRYDQLEVTAPYELAQVFDAMRRP